MPYDPDGFWIADPVYEEDFTSGGYDSDFNYGVGTGDLSTSDIGIGGASAGGDYSGYDWAKLGKSLLGKAATPAGIAALGTVFAGLAGADKPSAAPGWKGTIDPNAMTASREQIAQPAYVPYSGQPVMGRKHFTDTQYTAKAAEGGLMGFAAGGDTKKPRYLEGATDGMADKISTSIDGDQPAALSHGEFVVPADVVSHLGNGNSEAGSKVLYRMMDRIRHARTGNKEQGKRINPEKFTPGGIAGYAGGGVVAFAGEAGSLVGTQGKTGAMPVSSESNLSSWAGPGIANYIQRGTALAQSPYQAYTGPLTAGTSPLQQQGFQAAGNLQTPASMGQATQMVGDVATKMGGLGYQPVGSDFTAQAAQQYMNPYLQASLDPQLAEARRQSDITQMGNAAKLSQAGAYGGSRGALMQSETQRNLGTNLANITGQGYNTAYDKAMQQFNADQQRKVQEGQFGSTYGLQALQGQQSAATALGGLGAQENAMGIANLNAQLGAGATQRGVEQEGISALRGQFEEQRLDPYKQVQFEQSLYQGLPVSTTTASTATSPFQQLKDVLYGAGGVYDKVNTITGG